MSICKTNAKLASRRIRKMFRDDKRLITLRLNRSCLRLLGEQKLTSKFLYLLREELDLVKIGMTTEGLDESRCKNFIFIRYSRIK